jgi:sugar/nucleoside kinase (ribokinase family)
MAVITVLGDFAVDRIDDGPAVAGGCPAFSGLALDLAGATGRIVARAARADAPLVRAGAQDSLVPLTLLETPRTTAFTLRYADGEERVMEVHAAADPWTLADLQAAAVDTRWIHVAPLLRSDFPAELLQRLHEAGHLISYDGQGLVRPARLGRLTLDAAYDHELLPWLSILKLAQDEAEVVAGGAFDSPAARSLGIREIIVTDGSRGCHVYDRGVATRVPAARVVEGVHATGAGDVFMVAYVARRAAGVAPIEAARRASDVVAQMLDRRRA